MAEIINLRRQRKQRKRKAAESEAAENRVRFAMPASRRSLEKARRDLEAGRHEGHRLDTTRTDPGSST